MHVYYLCLPILNTTNPHNPTHTHTKNPPKAPPSLLGPAHLRLLALEEKRLDLQPEKRGELLPLYEALLGVVRAFYYMLLDACKTIPAPPPPPPHTHTENKK